MSRGFDPNESLQLVDEEQSELLLINLEDFRKEPLDSNWVTQYKKCRRLTFGHPKPFGENHCRLEKITDDAVLREDDEVKNKSRLDRRKKRKHDSNTDYSDDKRHKGSDHDEEEFTTEEDDDEEVKEALRKFEAMKKKQLPNEKKSKLDRINEAIERMNQKETSERKDEVERNTLQVANGNYQVARSRQ